MGICLKRIIHSEEPRVFITLYYLLIVMLPISLVITGYFIFVHNQLYTYTLMLVFVIGVLLFYVLRLGNVLMEYNNFRKFRNIVKFHRGFLLFKKKITLVPTIVTIEVVREGNKLNKIIEYRELDGLIRGKKFNVHDLDFDVKVLVNEYSHDNTVGIFSFKGYTVKEYPGVFIGLVLRGYFTDDLPDSIPVYYQDKLVGVYEVFASLTGDMIVRCIEGCDNYQITVSHTEYVFDVNVKNMEMVIPFDFDDDVFFVTTISLFSEEVLSIVSGDEPISIRGSNTIIINVYQKYNNDILMSDSKIVRFDKL